MKRLSLLVALILCVTIGGVYATWFYAEAPMAPATHDFKNLGITDVNTTAQSGKISVTDTLILKIDDNEGNHIPGWDAEVTGATAGNLQIVFTPNSGAGDTTLNYTITIAKNKYTDGSVDKPIFTTTSITDAHDAAETILTGSFSFSAGETQAIKEISLKDITDVLKVNSDIELTDINEYNAYKTALDGVELVLTVSEPTP